MPRKTKETQEIEKEVKKKVAKKTTTKKTSTKAKTTPAKKTSKTPAKKEATTKKASTKKSSDSDGINISLEDFLGKINLTFKKDKNGDFYIDGSYDIDTGLIKALYTCSGKKKK